MQQEMKLFFFRWMSGYRCVWTIAALMAPNWSFLIYQFMYIITFASTNNFYFSNCSFFMTFQISFFPWAWIKYAFLVWSHLSHFLFYALFSTYFQYRWFFSSINLTFCSLMYNNWFTKQPFNEHRLQIKTYIYQSHRKLGTRIALLSWQDVITISGSGDMECLTI